MDRQCRSKPFDVNPPAGAAVAQFMASERGEPADCRIFSTDRRSDEAITDAVEGFPPYLCDEGFLDREREEGGRRGAADPERKAPVADMNTALGDGA